MEWMEGEKLDERETEDFVAAVFSLWFEQKLFREVCKDQISPEKIRQYDLGSVGLNIVQDAVCQHELLGDKEAVLSFTKCLLALASRQSNLLVDEEVGESAAAFEDESSPVFNKEKNEILSHYIQ